MEIESGWTARTREQAEGKVCLGDRPTQAKDGRECAAGPAEHPLLLIEGYVSRASRSTCRSGNKEKNPIRKAMPISDVISEYQKRKSLLSVKAMKDSRMNVATPTTPITFRQNGRAEKSSSINGLQSHPLERRELS